MRLVALSYSHHGRGIAATVSDLGHEVVAVMDPEPKPRQQLAQQFDCPGYAAADTCLDAARPDAAIVCGKHVAIPGYVQACVERRIPYLGICYGFQWAAVEFARHVCGLADADSTECHEQAPHKIIYKLRDLLGVDDLGGTMRLGSYPCRLEPGSLAARLYAAPAVSERHRHRYEFNREYERPLADSGLRISGRSPDGKFVEVIELPGHPWFLAVQFHPEFQSKPLRPHPLFAGFVRAAYEHAVPARATADSLA